MVENLLTLLMLVALQVVLGFDNLLYISLESKRAPKEKQGFVRNVGIGVAILLRVGLLFMLINLIKFFQNPILTIPENQFFVGEFNIHSLIVLLGGAFIVYTATKEVLHMMSLEDDPLAESKPRSVGMSITMIILMNVVFSFDSILSAMALTEVFWVMATAIVVGGLLMILMAGKVSAFLQKNRMYEVLGLFILFVVGIMLITEGGHLAHLVIFENEIMPMTKTTFYFVIVILVLTDIVQSRYQKKLQASKIEGEELDQQEAAKKAAE